MKKIQKTLLGMLLAASLTAGAAAQGEALECAAKPVEVRSFEHYPSHAYDSETGKWSVRSNQADALIDRFWTYGASSGSRTCVFNLELEGNVVTGVWTPVLRFYYMNGNRIDASAVSVLAGETRYDFAAVSSDATDGYYRAECISVPLNWEAMSAVQAMMECEEITVRLIGERIYTVDIKRESPNTREKVEGSSLTGLASAMELLEEAGLNDYDLWDLSADAWKNEYGFAPAFACSQVVKTIGETTVRDDFGMVMRNDQTTAAKAAQNVLAKYGFMNGAVYSSFNSDAVDAVKRAQHYLGMVETGCMDAQLEMALASGRAEEAAAAFEMQPVGGVAQIALNRYWFADGVSASAGPESVRTVLNKDNVLLAADGWIRNVSTRDLSLFTELEAQVVYGDDYAFEADLVCECDNGTDLDMTMLPMAQARLIVYAEIPAWLAEEEGASWRIVFTASGENLEYELQ